MFEKIYNQIQISQNLFKKINYPWGFGVLGFWDLKNWNKCNCSKDF